MPARDQLWLTLVVQDLDVITFVVPPSANAYLGRDPSSNDLVLHDAKVSRTHARIRPYDLLGVARPRPRLAGARRA